MRFFTTRKHSFQGYDYYLTWTCLRIIPIQLMASLKNEPVLRCLQNNKALDYAKRIKQSEHALNFRKHDGFAGVFYIKTVL